MIVRYALLRTMNDQVIDILGLRESLGWSQDRMADYLGVNRSNVSRMETGQTGIRGSVARLLKNLQDAKENGTVALVAPDPSPLASSEEMAS
jgi:transcriptional regulator with XRE-family HTH domain